MNEMGQALLTFFLFPGFLFSASLGLAACWVDRKVTARIQYRVGPPWYQPAADVIKLFFKESTIPAGSSRSLFFGMPLLALVSATLVAAITVEASLSQHRSFVGDLIVVFYFSVLPSLALMMGGFFSANPLASIGASREMKLILAYELPFIVILAVPVVKAGYSVQLGQIVAFQAHHGAFVASPSGFLALIAAIAVLQAKLGLGPFDVAEAETEIMAGALIEYSGRALGFWKLVKAVLFAGLPLFVITVLWGGIQPGLRGAVSAAGKYVVLIVATILIRNTNPRVRIDHALRFFWGPVTAVALLALALALAGM